MLGWKLLITIPYHEIEKEIMASMMYMLLFVFLALILLSITTLIILDKTIIRPLSYLTDITRNITETGNLDQKIELHNKVRSRNLHTPFERMIGKLKQEEEQKKRHSTSISS
jgi:nitrogen fixation/metabolism regulation signal transduction histidine kinase